MKHPPVNYHEYLKLDALLGAQALRSEEFKKPAHDEMLFIIVHQTYELWFRQMIWELDSVLKIFGMPSVPEYEMGQAVARLERVVEIQKHINKQIDVLETMTPFDFLEFRDFLYPASGFQSFQWRVLETKLGLHIEQRLTYNQAPFYAALPPDQQKLIKDALEGPSLFSAVEKWLERTPFLKGDGYDFWEDYRSAVNNLLSADEKTVSNNPRLGPEEKKKTLDMLGASKNAFDAFFDPSKYLELQKTGYFRLSQRALQAALFIQVYRDQPALQIPHRLISALINLDEKQTEWRQRHAQMVHRMLGKKIGTGGSSGHDYLKATADKHKIFTDFFNLTTFLIPRSAIPALPKKLVEKLNFSF